MNAHDILKYGNLTFEKTLEAMPQAHYDEPGACGVWSVKDIIAHLASYEALLVDVLSTFTGGDATPVLDQCLSDPAAFNDDQVLLRQDRPADAVLAEYHEMHERVKSLAAQVPAEEWRQPGTLPWYGSEYSLDDLIVYQYYGHKREHSAQIAAFRDRVVRGAHLDGDQEAVHGQTKPT